MCEITQNNLNQMPLTTLPIPQLDMRSRKRGSRLKFWEINTSYHCAALGTCLTLKELRQLANKANVQDVDNWDDYCTHVSFLKTLDAKCYVATLVNKHLDKKYKINILYFSKTKSEEERLSLWNEAARTGDIAGALWAILTHPDSTDDNLYQVYGKVHMLSHISGATARIDISEFNRLEKRNHALWDQLNTNELVYNKSLDKKKIQISHLNTELLQLQKEKSVLKKTENELNEIKNKPLLKDLQDQLSTLKVELEGAQMNTMRLELSNQKLELIAEQAEKENKKLKQQLDGVIDERESTENFLSNLLNQEDRSIDDCESCPNTNPDLCGRCVLYIGGRNSQYAHFRQLVEQQNGAFIHHDGGREDSPQKLASIVSKADVVVCPLDCVSHNAMNAVKRHCQINTKQLVFIPHASLSAFSKGLTEVIN